MQNLNQILRGEGLQGIEEPYKVPVVLPLEPEANLNSSQSVPTADLQNLDTAPEDLLLGNIDDTKGRYTAKALAEEFNLSSAGLRNVWYPHLLAVVGGDRYSQRLRRGKFTELARHLFSLYSSRPDEQTAEDWIEETQGRLASESAIASVEVEVLSSELVLSSETFYEEQSSFLDIEVDACRGRSQLMLQKMQALQAQAADYQEIGHAQQVQAAREQGYERRLELLLAQREGALQAEQDVLGVQNPVVTPADQFFKGKK